ncbi:MULTISPECIES: hypothetical protein [Aeromonas]|uniref:hypothetical protein n=1 Tax=Aeromonas media TaxID=651 RepID=UPI0038D1A921
MTYDYHIEFLTQFDRDQIPDGPVLFHSALKAGDIVQLDEFGEYHLVRLITHSPVGSTLWLSGKGQDLNELLLSQPELTEAGAEDLLITEFDAVIAWQKAIR